MRLLALSTAVLALAACAQIPVVEVSSRAQPLPGRLPPMKTFSAAPAIKATVKSNRDIARDFLELTFELESGKKLSRLTRFQEPITVALAAPGPARFESDLAELLARLRNEAGINIRQSRTGQPANIVIETLPRKKLHALVPQAACFVVPRVTSWQDFRKNRLSGKLDWSTLNTRSRATVFIPDDVAPQEARDCLHEEIAQSLGPLNDIYRLQNSIFNDDNMNSVLTGFDMLILRTYYAPQLKNGMTKAQVAARLPGILDRLNPAGRTAPDDGQTESPRAWINTLENALGAQKSRRRRVTNARAAAGQAAKNGWRDNRLGFSLFALGRLALGQDSTTSIDSFRRAYQVYLGLYGTDDIHTAHVALQLAAFSLSGGHSQAALDLVNQSLPAVSRAQDAGLLAAFLMIKAKALDDQGRHSQAATVRLDSLGWARYGFASDSDIRARLRETAALSPGAKKPGV